MNILRVLNRNIALIARTSRHIDGKRCIISSSRTTHDTNKSNTIIDEMPQQRPFGITKVILNMMFFTFIGSMGAKLVVNIFEKEKMLLNDDEDSNDEDN